MDILNTKLSDLKLNESCIVLNVFHNNTKLRYRLLEMGLTKNTFVTIKKISPLGDPVSIEFRNYQLCLRKKDLKGILVKLQK